MNFFRILSFITFLFFSGNYISSAQVAYTWRGCMLDVSRHFFSIDFLKKQIDIFSHLGLNTMHLHLTDAGGWRLEIKQYPELTVKAAWRTQSDWDKWWNQKDRRYAHKDDIGSYGGYYSQKEMMELVNYAQKKGITIVPEIEMPGHSEEVLETFKDLKCMNNNGPQADYCLSNPKTYQFLCNIIDEVINIFPSKYIHIGGDEASFLSWEKCPRCNELRKKLKLASTHQLQDYFMRKMTKYICSKGKRAIVWDEALTDSLASNTIIMVWRNANTAKEALQKGYDVIMSPTTYCYLDYYQDSPISEPRAIGGYLPFDSVCHFQHIDGVLGLQGNLWTEYIDSEKQVEYMLYPRLFALAEIAKNPLQRQSTKLLRKKAIRFVDSLHAKGINAFNIKQEQGQRKLYYKTIKHKAFGSKVTYNTKYSPYYPGKGYRTLTDGKLGSWQHGDKRWQGFIGKNALDIVIDLGNVKKIKSIEGSFMQSDVAWIFFPKSLKISTSIDGNSYHDLSTIKIPKQAMSRISFKRIGWKGKKQKMRFIRIEGETTSADDWLFIDEVIIK